jgi:hypothetical protein
LFGLLEFVKNVPHWLRDELCRTSLSELRARLRVRAGAVRRRLASRLGLGPAASPQVCDFLDLSRIPRRYADLFERHYRALRGYVPRPYSGRVALFRARSQPLLRWQEPLMGWQELLTGSVEPRIIPGTHDTILTEPGVEVLARELEATLARASKAPSRAGCCPPAWLPIPVAAAGR